MKSKLLVLSAALMLVLCGCQHKSEEFVPDDNPGGDVTPDVVHVTSVSLNQTSATLNIGDTLTLQETVLPENATNKGVSWSASNGNVSVDDGLVTALQAGTSTVTVTTLDGSITASCDITIPQPQAMDIGYADPTFEFNGTEQRGQFVYWAGDGGAVSSATYNASTKKYSLNYTTGWAWYGVQIFYLAPYMEGEDKVDLSWTVNSPVAGSITVNGAVKNLVAGENVIELSNSGLNANRTLNVQLGVDGGAQFGNGTFTFSTPVLHDRSGNTYHKISFANGSNILKEIPVKNGKLVSAPADPTAPAGQVFAGWYDGTVKFDATQGVTAAHAYTAKFINESEATKYTVTVYDGSNVLGTVQVLEGSKVDLSGVEMPFAYEAAGYYRDSAFNTAFNPATEVINSNTDIYVKKQVMVSASSYNMYADYVTHLANGALQIQLTGWAQEAWKVQLNYLLPVGTHNYTINFNYSIDKAGADVQIYDNATKAGPLALAVGNNQNLSLNYNGALSAQNKLTFELGALPAETCTFVLNSITLTIA